MAIREDVIILQGHEYCTYPGVLARAHALGLDGIITRMIQIPSDENGQVAIVEAEVRLKDGRVFTDVGDASPRNVKPHMVGAIIRLASTRAKGRALRDAVNIGETLAEELPDSEPETPRQAATPAGRPIPPAQELAAAVLVCSECGKTVTKPQLEVSVRSRGRAMCPACQRNNPVEAAPAAH